MVFSSEPLSHLNFSCKTSVNFVPPIQRYVGGDQLVAALKAGWTLAPVVTAHVHQLRGGAMSIYYFRLSRQDEVLTLSVIDNPFIQRLIVEGGLEVVAQLQSHDYFRKRETNRVLEPAV